MDFENFYITWYSRVKYFARDYVLSDEEAENIAQDVFLEFYQKREELGFHINLVAYLFTSVKNKCIDYLRRRLMEQEAAVKMQEEFDLDTLPERCREIFVMSKIKGKKQKEIAEELNVSVKTIESQMTIAYKKLREELKNHLPLLLFLLSSWEN